MTELTPNSQWDHENLGFLNPRLKPWVYHILIPLTDFSP